MPKKIKIYRVKGCAPFEKGHEFSVLVKAASKRAVSAFLMRSCRVEVALAEQEDLVQAIGSSERIFDATKEEIGNG